MKVLRIAAAAAALLAALATGALAQTTLRIGLAEDPDILDPTLARTFVGRIVFAGLCDKLLDLDEKLNIVPQLATSYEWSGDNKALTLKLRSGVTFHDGEKFDAQAVKFNLERHKNMQGSNRRGELAPVSSVDAMDPATVRINLAAPFAPLLAALTDRAGMMVSPKAARELGDRFGTRPVCAGRGAGTIDNMKRRDFLAAAASGAAARCVVAAALVATGDRDQRREDEC